ncbi:MAG: hypothetical protein QOJ40_2475 [Verrucomicrobiota bacterium]
MDFFDRQAQAHRNTKLLVVYFIAGVTLLIASVYLVTLLIFAGIGSRHHRYRYSDDQPQLLLWNPKLFLGVAVGTLAVIGMGSAFKTIELAQGGSAVATSLGGRLVSSNSDDPAERKLLDVVEEMAIASGVPVPQVYVLDEEQGINAFAAGHSTSDAVITVTRGTLQMLTRDELQGVIGHEFSHILNGDMRLNIRLMGILFGILCLAFIGRILLQTRSGNSRDRNPLPLLGLALLVIGWIGVFFGRLIQAAVSRQREFLADASSVQFTRNPGGLSGALQKIGRYSFGSHIESPHADQVSHMFFGNGVSEPLFNLLATHPPIPDRIHAIDPAWDGKFPPIAEDQIDTIQRAAISQLERARAQPSFFGAVLGAAGGSALMGEPIRPPSAPPAPPRFSRPSSSALAQMGAPGTAHLRYAEELRSAIPETVQTAARDSLGASALVYALLIGSDPDLRKKQLELLSQNTSEGVREETERLLPEVASVAVHAKMPLVDLALPALRNFSAGQYEEFTNAIKIIIESDNQIDLFEYVLQKVVLRHLDPHFNGARKPVIQYYALKPLVPDCSVILSALAYVGQDDPEKIRAAFQQGAELLSYNAQAEVTLVTPAQCDLSQVDAALNRLTQAAPQIKKNVLTACAQTVAADGVIQEMEAELLRAVADTLDCPMPPFIPNSTAS